MNKLAGIILIMAGFYAAIGNLNISSLIYLPSIGFISLVILGSVLLKFGFKELRQICMHQVHKKKVIDLIKLSSLLSASLLQVISIIAMVHNYSTPSELGVPMAGGLSGALYALLIFLFTSLLTKNPKIRAENRYLIILLCVLSYIPLGIVSASLS